MKRLGLFTFIIVSSLAQAQTRIWDSAELFGRSQICSTGGPNSTFTTAGGDGARQVSHVITWSALDGRTEYLARYGFIEIESIKADDDSLIVLLSGYADTCSSSVYLDTIYIPVAAGKATYALMSPSLFADTTIFPYRGRFSVANADSGNTGQFPYFGEVADTNVWSMRVILWH